MEPKQQSPAVVSCPASFTFDSPAEPGSVQTQLRMGAVVNALESREVGGRGWTRVTYGWGLSDRFDEPGCNEEGWLESSALVSAADSDHADRYASRPAVSTQSPSDPEATPEKSVWLQVTSLAAHGFAKPSRTAGPSVAVLPFESWLWGESLTEVQAAPGAYGSRWWRVVLPGGAGLPGEVYVQAGDVVPGGLGFVSEAQAMNRPTAMAGRPYVWGGSTSAGYDCSGLVQMTARRRGLALPHSARRQFTESFDGLLRVGEDLAVEDVAGEVRTDAGRGDRCSALGLEHAERAEARWGGELRQGDVVYFAMGGKRVDHVGLWAGNGAMIHASSSGVPSTRREPFWPSVFAARMTGVRRITV